MARSRQLREEEIARRVLKHWHEAVPNDRIAHLVKDATRSFLRILWERDGLTQRELSVEAGFMEPTTLIALRAMEALGYVTRKRMPQNRKNNYVFLTARGKRLKKELVPLAENVNRMALAGLRANDVAATRRSLLTMIDNLARDVELTGAQALKPPGNARAAR